MGWHCVCSTMERMWRLFLFISLCCPVHWSYGQARQENRFQKPIRDLQRSLNKGDPEKVLEQLVENGNRADLFELEALLRVYESEYPETLEGFLQEDIKPFEDTLGKWLDTREALSFSEQVGAPKAVVIYLKGREGAAKEVLKDFLENKKFIRSGSSESPLKKLLEATEETDWEKKKKDRKLVLKEFSKLLKEVDKTEYDMKLLEDGIHELRRDLRWIPIYLRTFNDLFKLDERKMPEAKIKPEDPVTKSPYSKLPRPRDRVAFPILFPKLGFLAVNRAVDRLGKAKDMGKAEEMLGQALLKTGEANTVTEARKLAKALVKKHPEYVPVFGTALAIYRSMTEEEHGLVGALRELLREQKHWDKEDCKTFLQSIQSQSR